MCGSLRGARSVAHAAPNNPSAADLRAHMNPVCLHPLAAPTDRSSSGSADPSSADSSSAGSSSDGAREETRVILVDDHPAIREVLSSVINDRPDMRVVGESASAKETLSLVEETSPDVLVVDISLEGADGLSLIRSIRAKTTGVRVIVFSMYDENIFAERAIRAGASGYIMKTKPTDTIVRAIEVVNSGQVYLSQDITSRILSKVIRTQGYTVASLMEELTDRELTVFRMLGEGYSITDIADHLGLNRKTVETYRRRAKDKLGYDTVDELLQHAVSWVRGQEERVNG